MTDKRMLRTFSVEIMSNSSHDNQDRSLEGILKAIQAAVKECGPDGEFGFDYGYDGDVAVEYSVVRMETDREMQERIAQVGEWRRRSAEYQEEQDRANYESLKRKFEGKKND